MTDPTIILKLSYIAYSILNIRPLDLVLIKIKINYILDPNIGTTTANGGFVNKAN